MPNNRKQTKTKSRPKGAPRRATPRKRGPRMAVPQMMGAPAGVSQDLQQFTNFYPSGNGGNSGLQIHSCAAIYEVNKSVTTVSGVGLFNAAGPTNTTYASAQLNMTDPVGLSTAGTKVKAPYMTPIFDLIASAFVRYRVKKLIFHYEPQAAATDGDRLVFAFANDPLHPLLWNSTLPTQASLLSLSDSIAFMPWRAWSMDVSDRVNGDRLFTYSDTSTTVAEFAERFSDFGVISLLTGTTESTLAQCGVLYMETVIELEEFCPISVTRPALLSNLAEKAHHHIKRSGNQSGSRPREETLTPSDSCQATNEGKTCSC